MATGLKLGFSLPFGGWFACGTDAVGLGWGLLAFPAAQLLLRVLAPPLRHEVLICNTNNALHQKAEHTEFSIINFNFQSS